MAKTEWTANQLKEYVDRVFDERRRCSDEERDEVNRRLTATINARERLAEQCTHYLTQENYNIGHRQLQNELAGFGERSAAALAAHAKEDDIQHTNLRERIATNTLEIATKQGLDEGVGRHRAEAADHNRFVISVLAVLATLLGAGIAVLALVVH